MRLTVDPGRCKGHAQCVLAAPNVVTLNDAGRSQVISEVVDPACEEEARTAELLCPEEAFTITE